MWGFGDRQRTWVSQSLRFCEIFFWKSKNFLLIFLQHLQEKKVFSFGYDSEGRSETLSWNVFCLPGLHKGKEVRCMGRSCFVVLFFPHGT